METRWYYIIPITPILVILLILLGLGAVFVTFVGHGIYTYRWYIFGFFCLVSLINFFLIIKKSDIICGLSFLFSASPVLYYILYRSELFATDDPSTVHINFDYILCVIFYIVITILMSVAVFSLSHTFLDKDYTYSITDNYRESVKYFFKMLAVSAVGWGFNAFVFFVAVPIYSFDY